jgi:hypothetical protein
MELVTQENLSKFVELYAEMRGGDPLNQDTYSEAGFVLASKYQGVYFLHTGIGIVWIGLQNASSRWTNKGELFRSVTDALEAPFKSNNPEACHIELYFSKDSTDRFEKISEIIERFKNDRAVLVMLK